MGAVSLALQLNLQLALEGLQSTGVGW